MKKRISLFLLFALVLLNCNRPQQSRQVPALKAGDISISATELEESFFLRPKFKPWRKGREAFEEHIRGYLAYRYLAEQAEKRGLDEDEQIRSRLHWMRKQAMREQLFRQVVADRVHISEGEKRLAFARSNVQLDVRHLFVPTKEQALALKERLDNGESFFDLARKVYADAPEMAQSGGSLGTITWGEMDPDFEAAAFSLQPGQVSDPVRTKWGYHIIKVDGIVRNPIVTEMDYRRQSKRIERILRARKEDSLATIYVADVMKNLDVRVKGPAFSFIVNKAKEAMKNRAGLLPDKKPRISDRESGEIIGQLADRADEIFVTYKGGQWTIGDFLQRFRAAPPQYRPHVYNAALFEKELRNMIRDEFLYRRAKKMGLGDHPYVQKRVREMKRDLLAARMRRELTGHIRISRKEVRDFYASNKKLFGDDPTQEMWREIERRALKARQDSLVAAFVDDWLQKTTIVRNDSLLDQVFQDLGGERAAFMATWQVPYR